jgi:hypothetical protein
MKAILVLNLLMGLMSLGWGQNSFPEGIYLNADLLCNKNPSGIFSVEITRHSDIELKRSGGNDYSIQCDAKFLKRKQQKREVFAVVHHDSIFVNGLRIGVGKDYALALTQGRFICFYAALPGSRILQNQLKKAGLYKPSGGLISPGKSYSDARFYYIYDVEKDQINILDSIVVEKILSSYPTLYSSYKTEQIKSPEILIKYISELNKYLVQ